MPKFQVGEDVLISIGLYKREHGYVHSIYDVVDDDQGSWGRYCVMFYDACKRPVIVNEECLEPVREYNTSCFEWMV